MADNYQSQFKLLLEEVHAVSPQAAEKLMQIETALGARAAFYAAFVIVCLEARGKQSNYRIVTTLKTDELNNFTYFEFTKGNTEAVSKFSEVLADYQADCKRRFSMEQNAAAAV